MLTVANHLDQQWVGLITYLQATTATAQGSCDVDGNYYLEHIIRIDMTKSSMCWLEVVECLQQCRYVSNHTYSKYSPSMNSQIWNYEFMNIYNSLCVCVCKHDWLCIHPLRLSMTSTNNAINRQRQAWVSGLKPTSCSINNILYLLYNNILYLLGP